MIRSAIEAARRAGAAALAALLVGSLAGCIGAHWAESDPVYDDGLTSVLVETRTNKGAEVDQGYAHPAKVPAEWLEPFVASVSYDEPRLIGSVKGKQVFDRDAARILASRI